MRYFLTHYMPVTTIILSWVGLLKPEPDEDPQSESPQEIREPLKRQEMVDLFQDIVEFDTPSESRA